MGLIKKFKWQHKRNRSLSRYCAINKKVGNKLLISYLGSNKTAWYLEEDFHELFEPVAIDD